MFLSIEHSRVEMHRWVRDHSWESISVISIDQATSTLSQRYRIQGIGPERLLNERSMHISVFAPQSIDLQTVVLQVFQDVLQFLTDGTWSACNFWFFCVCLSETFDWSWGCFLFDRGISVGLRCHVHIWNSSFVSSSAHQLISSRVSLLLRCWTCNGHKGANLNLIGHTPMYFHKFLNSEPSKRWYYGF